MFRRLVMVTILLFGMLNSLPTANAAEATSRFVVQDGKYKMRWTFLIKHPTAVNCDWGKIDPRDRIYNTAACTFPVSLEWSWEADSSAGYSNDPVCPENKCFPFNGANFQLLTPNAKNIGIQSGSFGSDDYIKLIEWTGPATGKGGTGSGSLTKNITFVYDNPTEFTFGYRKSALLYPQYEIVVEQKATKISILGKTSTERIAELEAIKAQENAKIRAQAEAEAKIKAQAEAESKIRAQAEAEAKAQRASMELNRVNSIKYSIECKKSTGNSKIKKVVSGDPPKCPKGYFDERQKFAPYMAYLQCKLYKRDNKFETTVALQDNGKTLSFNGLGLNESLGPNIPKGSDLDCALGSLKVPSYIANQIGTTRAIDGRVTVSWAKMRATWTFHPESGLNIFLSQKV
jgi:hypothetical protein